MDANYLRSERAYRTVLYYGQSTNSEGSSVDELITDLATDLLHLSGEYGLDAEELQRMAWHHYQAELVEQATSS